mgnify:CR=1 FL=1
MSFGLQKSLALDKKNYALKQKDGLSSGEQDSICKTSQNFHKYIIYVSILYQEHQLECAIIRDYMNDRTAQMHN